jgi:hypothetical protein
MHRNLRFESRPSALLLCGALVMPWSIPTGLSAADIQDAVRADQEFDYQSERDVWIDVEVFDIEGTPAANRVIEILEPLDEAGFRTRLIDKGVTDDGGRFDRGVRVPSYLTQLVIRVRVLGIENQVMLPLDGSDLRHEFR